MSDYGSCGSPMRFLSQTDKEASMSLLTAFVMIAALFAAISLFDGVVSMAHGGADDQLESHRWMFKRVGWQGLAVLFILLALLSNLK